MADREFNVRISAETDDFSRGIDRAEREASELGATLDDDLSQGARNASESIRETTEELRRMQQEAMGARTSVGSMSGSFGETSSSSNKFNREMQRLSMVLGGEVPESTKQAYKEMYKLNEEARKAKRYYGAYSQEALNARDAITQFALGLDDTTFKQIYMRSQLGLTDAQLRQQANSIKLNARMTQLMGNQTQILVQRMQGLAKHGIKPEMMLPPSTIGQFQLLNETVNASGRGIYNLSSMYRNLGGSVEKVIKNYSAQKVAIREAQGDMVKYGLLLRGITAANANMALAFPIVGLAALTAYKTMFNAALEADKGLKKLAETTKKKVLKALDPLISAAGDFLRIALKVVGAVSDWVAKFNEAHPIISKIVGAIGFLLPAMTLLLLPLQMGIGLWKGWMVALNGVWTMFGGVVSMIGLASSTFLAFAGIVGAVAGAFIYLWKTNEGFKSAIIGAWQTIKTKATEIWGGLAEMFMTTLPNAYKAGGIEGLFVKLSEIVNNALINISALIPQFLQKGSEIVIKLLEGISVCLPQAYVKSTEIVSNIANGIIDMLPTFIQTAITIITAWLDMISKNLPIILDAGCKILEALIEGIIKILPQVVETVVEIIDLFVTSFTENLPKIIDMGIELIESLLDGIIKSLPQIIDGALKIILALVDGIANNLPKIIDAGIRLITTLASTLVQNTPQILSAIGQVMVALGRGIIQAIPQIASSMGRVVKEGANAIKNAIPNFLRIGGDIIAGLVRGIKNSAGRVVSALGDVVKSAIRKAKSLLGINSPSKLFMQFGEWTTEGYEIGVNRGEKSSTRSVENFANNSINAFTTTALPASSNNSNSSIDNSNYTININAGNLNNERDMYKLAQIIDKKLAEIKQNKSISRGGARVVY